MDSKLGIRAVIKDHFATLVVGDTSKRSMPDLVLFYLVPIIVGVVLVKFNFIFGRSLGNALIIALSIFAGLLFNVLLLILNIASKMRSASEKLSANSLRLKEICSNVSYAVLISLLTIVAILLHFGFLGLNLKIGLHLTSFFVYAMCGNFILTMLLVLKRVHSLLITELGAS
jgi:hypothetical protein